MPRLAVLVSGTGTNLESILAAGLPVDLVLADRHCRALQLAANRQVPTALISRTRFGYRPRATWDRGGFTRAIDAELEANQIDLVAMAGFMTILGPGIFEAYSDRILNTHPSLLPAFKGAHAVPLALAAGVPQTGVTVHVATSALDSGRILAQATVPVLPGDTESTLHARIKVAEHTLYPATIRDYLATLG
jgi:phosphoribosylglycinamide formyltransferase-1